jgi:hypothetical protein
MRGARSGPFRPATIDVAEEEDEIGGDGCARSRVDDRLPCILVEFDRFLDVIRAFERESVLYVLVGGVAVNLHGIARATGDIDFFVRPDPENVERLKRALRSVWDDPEIDGIRAADFETYPTLRYGPPSEEIVIDILTRLGSAFAFDDLESETLEVEGTRVRVATRDTLVRMKRNTVRPIDKADVAALEQLIEDENRR